MTDTHEETCSQGRDATSCCASYALQRIEQDGASRHGYWLAEMLDGLVDGRVIAVARAIGLDPHALDDNVQGRGWEYHDRGIERAIVQGAYALLHPDDDEVARDESGSERPSLYENIAAALAAEDVLERACCSCPKDHEVVLAVINREIHNWEQP